MTREFFKLEGSHRDIDEQTFYNLVETPNTTVKNLLYRPGVLTSRISPRRWRVHDIIFVNVSLSKTHIKDFEFNNCKFLRCLFINTIFENCRFTNCSFVDSNPYRIEFRNVYVDPRSFVRCLDKKLHENIGVYLFQEILRNSRQLSQPDFVDEAQYHFRRWQRYLLIKELKNSTSLIDTIKKFIKIVLYFIFDKTTGSGTRLSSLFASSLFVYFLIVILNWKMACAFGLEIHTIIDSIYFSTIIITTVGFGDITPSSDIGRLVVSLEAFTGFVLLATLASTIYRRIST